MTKPTTLADSYWASETLVPRGMDGSTQTFDVSYTVPAATAATTTIGMVRVFAGDRIEIDYVRTDDLDTSTNVTLDLGIAYDDNTNDTDDPNAFYNAISGQAAGRADRTASSFQPSTGENFVVPSDGYIILYFSAGPTTTEGDVYISGTISRTRGYA